MAIPVAPSSSPGMDPAKMYAWVKGLESKANNLLRQVDVFKHDYVKKNTDLKREVKALTDDLMELKHQHEATAQKMEMIIKELRQTAGIEQVETMKKYLDLWNPLHFVTQRDVERLVEMKLEEGHAARVVQSAVHHRQNGKGD